MFKYLLYWGITDIVCIFSSSKAVFSVDTLRRRLRDADRETGVIWTHPTKSFTTRLQECKEILEPLIHRAVKVSTFSGIPSQVAEKLDGIFRRHYERSDFLLIGCTEYDSYSLQQKYSDEIVSLLEPIDQGYASRALALLGKAHGRTSIPLLCLSSVAALWEICKSSFYRRQLKLVSSPYPCTSPF